MGNVCCGSKDEKSKLSAFQSQHGDGAPHDVTTNHLMDATGTAASTTSNSTLLNSNANALHTMNNNSTNELDAASSLELENDKRRMKALLEEQARLEQIVQSIGRGMVAVRSTRGSTGYYDQGFAAALSQHLEQTTQFSKVPMRIPNNHNNHTAATATLSDDSVYARLSQPLWDGIALGLKGEGLAGCAGENPYTFLDHVAESFLDAAIPKKERLFAGASPIVENLL